MRKLGDVAAEFDSAVARFHRIAGALPSDLCLHIPGLGLQAIEPDGGLYRPADRGRPAVIAPVFDGPTPSFTEPSGYGEMPQIIDLVAFRLSEPWRWWRRTGLALYLGEHLIMRSNTWQTPVRVVATPLAWLN